MTDDFEAPDRVPAGQAAQGQPSQDKAAQGQDRAALIRNAIVTAILEHRLRPGTKLGEDEIGSLYGASRTLVRAALQALAHEGIVVVEKNRGAFVARPTPAEALEVFGARRLIEPEVARLAAARRDAAWSARLDAHLAEEKAALDRGDDRSAIRLSGAFHILVAELAGHAVYAGFLSELIARSSLIVLLYASRRSDRCGTDHHGAIAAAIRAGDGAAAARLTAEHLAEIEAGLDLADRQPSGRRLAEILSG